MKNSDVLYLTSRSIEQCQPEHKQNNQNEKLKESKPNKNILIGKTFEAFKPKPKFFPFKKTYFKNMFKTNFVSEIGPVLYLQDLKNIHWPLKID